MRSCYGGPRRRALTVPKGKAPAIPSDGVAPILSKDYLLFAAVSTATPGG